MPSTDSRPHDHSRHRAIRSVIGAYLPDIILGANDGIITTFALVSGVTGASLSPTIVLILGFANLIGDGISMGASNILSRRSEATSAKLPGIASVLPEGVATFAGFVFAGMVPLIAYLLPWFSGAKFLWAVVFALTALFAVGASRSRFTRQGWMKSGLEMLFIGSLAASAAYGIGILGGALAGNLD
ncbi:MAG TPA: VIT1/CCC1 transporter family protein [Polyangiaceae bacterium]|nr:VIT1/CCC1 transporter family protein [Polyangiaceae bacterium]